MALLQGGRTLDWAFVESEIFGTGDANMLPPRANFAKLEPKAYGDMKAFALPTKLQGLSGIEKGRWYFKCGRTTGLTAGICNGTEAYIVATEDRYLLDAGGTMNKIAGPGYLNELVIINAKGGKTSQLSQEPFCQHGDSGSLIVDAAGDVAGLLWGEVTGCCGPVMNTSTRERAGGQYANAGLVTDIRDVVKALEAGRANDNDPGSGKLSVL